MSVERTPAVFLDRDGVLNAATEVDGVPRPPGGVESAVLLEGVEEACRRLRGQGILLIVVTNQPDIARGRVPRKTVDGINAWLTERLGLDAVFVCPHDDDDHCACRKPKPGLLFDAARRFSIDLSRSTMVGDRWRDIDAGAAAGVSTVFVDHGYSERQPTSPDITVSGLLDAVDFVCRRAAI